MVDEKGEILWGDQLMILFSRALLEEQPGATILGEVKCSQTLYDDIAKHGGQPIMWKAGHSLIKAKMKETGAALAGEMSGHLFFQTATSASTTASTRRRACSRSSRATDAADLRAARGRPEDLLDAGAPRRLPRGEQVRGGGRGRASTSVKRD